MTTDSSVTAHEEKPHEHETTRIPISDALRRRAQSLIKDRSIDGESRAIIRYALEISDPWLAEIVRLVDAGENVVAPMALSETPETNEDDSTEEKIEALAEIICRAGDEPETKSAALFVLMGTLENSRHPNRLANSAKHLAFSRCGELNLYGMVDAQLEAVDAKLLANNTHVS